MKPGQGKKPSATAIILAGGGTFQDKLRAVLEWITGGESEEAVRQKLSFSSEAERRELLEKAVAHYVAVGSIQEPGLRATLGWCLEASKACYQRMFDDGDYVGALKAIKQIKDMAAAAAMIPPAGGREDDGENESGSSAN